MTVPVEAPPPSTLVGFTERALSAEAPIVKVAECVPLKLPEITATVEVPRAIVVTGKSAVVAPEGTVTLAGTTAAALSLESATTAPLAGAALVRVTVPVEEDPPSTLAGFTAIDESDGGLIVNVAA